MKNQKGITLVALVITIIVMLILAGVSLSMVAGENGILTRAESAVEKNRAGEIKEALSLAVSENQMLKYAGETPLTQAQILTSLQAEGKLTAEEVAEIEANGKLTIGTTEIDFSIIEGNSREEIIFEVNNYTTNYKLICVYTNEENVAYKLKGELMYDITDSGYNYNGVNYDKVYGTLTKDNVTSSDFERVDANSVEIVSIVYNEDINQTGKIDINDAQCVHEVCNENETYYQPQYLHICLRSDCNRDKKATSDDKSLVMDAVLAQ